jgi:DNA-binding transcriptional ArsR family regulator
LFRLDGNIRAVLSQLDDSVRPQRVTVEQSERIVREALQEATEATATLMSIRAVASHLRWLQVGIAYGWELIVPGIIGVFALWLSLPPFLHTIAHWPWRETLRLP